MAGGYNSYCALRDLIMRSQQTYICTPDPAHFVHQLYTDGRFLRFLCFLRICRIYSLLIPLTAPRYSS